MTDPPDAESVAPVQRSVSSNRQLAVRGSTAGTSCNSTRTVHGAPGVHAVSGRTSIPATAPAAGGAGGMTGRPSGCVASRCGRSGPSGLQEQVDVGGDVVAQEDDLERDDRDEHRDRQQPRPDPGARGSSRAGRRRLSRSVLGRALRSNSTARSRGPGALRQRPHERSELRTHGWPVEGGARRLQPLPDRRHTGHGQLRHCAVELVDEPGVHRVPRADLSADCGGELAEQGGITPRGSPARTLAAAGPRRGTDRPLGRRRRP